MPILIEEKTQKQNRVMRSYRRHDPKLLQDFEELPKDLPTLGKWESNHAVMNFDMGCLTRKKYPGVRVDSRAVTNVY